VLDAERGAGDTEALGSSFTRFKYLAVWSATRALYCSSALLAASGSTTSECSGVDARSAVTLAPVVLASAMPCPIAALARSDPSMGSRMCLYMNLVSAADDAG